eukprot:2884964-Alexandrium_andersonii.AAC.1
MDRVLRITRFSVAHWWIRGTLACRRISARVHVPAVALPVILVALPDVPRLTVGLEGLAHRQRRRALVGQ